MRKLHALFFGLLPVLFSGSAAAVETNDFIVESAGDLAALCRAAPEHPYQQQALHFCHGFVVGAYHYHMKSTGGPSGSGFVCISDPAPSRDEAIAEFVSWLDANPAAVNEDAVDALFEWAAGRFPCP